jgi:hypothetical protein
LVIVECQEEFPLLFFTAELRAPALKVAQWLDKPSSGFLFKTVSDNSLEKRIILDGTS